MVCTIYTVLIRILQTNGPNWLLDIFPRTQKTSLSHNSWLMNEHAESRIRKFFNKTAKIDFLRVVHNQAILFLKSLSERVGFDIQRPWNWMMNFQIDSKSIENSNSESYTSDPTLSDIDFKNKMAWVWTTLKNIVI